MLDLASKDFLHLHEKNYRQTCISGLSAAAILLQRLPVEFICYWPLVQSIIRFITLAVTVGLKVFLQIAHHPSAFTPRGEAPIQNKKAGELSFSGLCLKYSSEAQEQPRLSPQFRHLKHAPLRTATFPQFGHVGASFMKWAMASFRVVIARPWTEPLPLRAPLPESVTGLSAITSAHFHSACRS